jgi:hypothetical protein
MAVPLDVLQRHQKTAGGALVARRNELPATSRRPQGGKPHRKNFARAYTGSVRLEPRKKKHARRNQERLIGRWSESRWNRYCQHGGGAGSQRGTFGANQAGGGAIVAPGRGDGRAALATSEIALASQDHGGRPCKRRAPGLNSPGVARGRNRRGYRRSPKGCTGRCLPAVGLEAMAIVSGSSQGASTIIAGAA